MADVDDLIIYQLLTACNHKCFCLFILTVSSISYKLATKMILKLNFANPEYNDVRRPENFDESIIF